MSAKPHELPYEFDLLLDIKTYEQIDRTAKYEGDCSDATPMDVVQLLVQHNLDIPESLESTYTRYVNFARLETDVKKHLECLLKDFRLLADDSWIPDTHSTQASIDTVESLAKLLEIELDFLEES